MPIDPFVARLRDFAARTPSFTVADLRNTFGETATGLRTLPPRIESALRSLLDEGRLAAIAPGRYRSVSSTPAFDVSHASLPAVLLPS